MKKYSQLIWLFVGALYGLLIRAAFEFLPSSFDGPMSLAFLIGAPLAAGAISVYGLKDEPPSVTQMFVYPWVATGLMMLGSAITLMEGSICIAMMFPLFLAISSVGGLAMGVGLRFFKGNKEKLMSVALLPLVLFVSEQFIPLTNKNIEIAQSVVVQAQPETIWQQIMTAKEINAAELPLSITHSIGVPKPTEGINVQENDEEVRYSVWEKGVNFKAKVTHKDYLRYIKWDYIFDEHSFPKGSMDEHVAIGGEFFDLKDTSFRLEPLNSNETRLTIVANYRVSSSINFYAVPASKVLGRDFINTILTLYKKRSEAEKAV
jgi:hypothetical protein